MGGLRRRNPRVGQKGFDAEEAAGRFRELMAECAREVLNLSGEQLDALKQHFILLQLWNRRVNLTSVKSVEELAWRHYCESVWLASLLPGGEHTVGDVGSGAGFPGYVIAVARPELAVSLIEADARKAVFLREVSRGIRNVRVCEGRAEALRERFDWIVARGVRWRSVVELVPRLAPAVALLVGQEDAARIVQWPGIAWRDPMRVPWRRSGWVVLGQVARR